MNLRPFDRSCGVIYANYLACWSHKLSREKTYVSSAAPDIENAHAGGDPGLLKQLASKWLERPSLLTESLQLMLGVP
jgi:hypothetical protein